MENPRVLMISLQKCGTHLVSGIAEKLGYQVTGWVVAKPPQFPESEDERLLDLFFTSEERHAAAEDPEKLKHMTMQAYSWLYIAWSMRTGTPISARHAMAAQYELNKLPDKAKVMLLPYDSMPANSFFIKHEMPLTGTDGSFILQWSAGNGPRIIFNYRDPRDVLISFVNYLTGKTKLGVFSNFAEYHVYHKIFTALPDMESRLAHALLDPAFPVYRDFAESLWLLRHPDVCKVSYEELVGERGGGCNTLREQAVARIVAHVGSDADPAELSQGLFKTDTMTFHRGRTGAWKEVFTDRLHRLYNARFGALAEAYGYPCHNP